MANTFKQGPFGGMWLDDNGNPAKGPSEGSLMPGGGQFGVAPPGVSVQSSSIAQQAAGAADPFASQRAQYQQPLAQLMSGPAQGQVNTDIASMRTASQQPMGGPYMDMLQKLMTDKNSITMTPGSQFAQEQGQQALERSQAAKGFLGSGNIMSELEKQGQGIAAQDYTQQLADIRAAAGLSQGQQAQQFGQAQQIAGASGGALQDQYARLAQLSGANTGSPGTAGSLLAKQFDWANQGGGGTSQAQSGFMAAPSRQVIGTDPSTGMPFYSGEEDRARDSMTSYFNRGKSSGLVGQYLSPMGKLGTSTQIGEAPYQSITRR